MDRRRSLFDSKSKGSLDPSLQPTHVSFLHGAGDTRRKKGELRQLSPEEKAVCALRKVLAKMSTRTRYFLIGSQYRVLDRQISPGAKAGEPGTYRFRGRCQMGVAHHSGEAAVKMIEFVVSFRDTQDSMGLPDIAYFDPTTIDEIPPSTPL